MKQLILILVAVIAAVACKDDDKKEPGVCGYEHATDIPWLKEKIKEQESSGLSMYAYLEQGEYNGGYLFWFGSCCPMCDIYPMYYDCSGTKIENPDFNKVKNRQIIWRGPNYECTI